MTVLMFFAAPAMAHFQMLYVEESALERGAAISMEMVFTHPFAGGPTMAMSQPRVFQVVSQRGDEGKAVKTDLRPYMQPIQWQGVSSRAEAYQAVIPREVMRSLGDYVFTLEPEPYLEKEEDKYIIYIHISDPTSYIEQNTQLDKELFERCYSLYLDKTYHMMPEEFAINKISLTQNNISRAFTCKVNYDASYNLISYEFFKSNIKAIDLTYEEADKLKETILKDLYEFAKNIKYNYQQDYDIHEMVARYMILCNYLVGLYLKDDLSISRYNNTSYNHITSDNISDLDKLNNMCRYKRAEYSCNNRGHSILGLEYYQHFTSPLRRYADIIVHRILATKLGLAKYIYTRDELDKICNKLNIISGLYKLSYQIRDIYDKVKNFNEILIGTIIYIDTSAIKIYINNLDLMLSFNMISKKLLDQVEIINKSDEVYIQNKDTSFILKLYQEVKLKIYHNKLNNKIFTIELLEPILKDFLSI